MEWDIPTLIANCTKAQVYGVELRTNSNYAHGVEVTNSPEQRAEVKKRFTDSPVKAVSVACSERMDWNDPEKLKAAIEAAKAHAKLSHDVGSSSLRIFPNTFHPDVPHEKTIEQIARAASEVGAYAANLGQEIALEAHGPAGELPTMYAIMEQVTQKNVRVRLNCSARDAEGEGFKANFNLVKPFIGRTIHIHGLQDEKYPYQQMVDYLVKMNWDGWALMENSEKVPDRVAALVEQRRIWEMMVKKGFDKAQEKASKNA